MEDPSANESRKSPFERRWRERFISFAERAEDDAGIAGWSATGLAARLRQFAAASRPNLRGERWLDAGCGAGTYARLLAERGATIAGIDYSLPTIVKAQRRNVEGVVLCVGDATRPPFADAAFDGTLCLGVTQALSDSEPLLAALARCVRPGGEIWIDALNASCIVHRASRGWRRLRRRAPHLRYERARRLKRTMLACGIESIEVIWMPILPARFLQLQRWFESAPARSLFRVLPPLAALLCHSYLVRGRLPPASAPTVSSPTRDHPSARGTTTRA